MILLTALFSSFITGCSCANRNHENTTSTEPPSATEKATSTPDTNNNNNDNTDNMYLLQRYSHPAQVYMQN